MWFIETVVLSCIITLGWTLMFSVPRRYILPCLLMTAFGFGLKTALVYQHVHLVVASFFGAMLASFLGVYFSKKYTLPPKALMSIYWYKSSKLSIKLKPLSMIMS